MKFKGIYAITPDKPPDIAKISKILQSGVCALQYRRKTASFAQQLNEAKDLQALCAQYQTPFIINDNLELCAQLEADGLHLGQDDTPLRVAQAHLKSQTIIGISCHNQLGWAQHAQDEGADYVAFGALFPSPTKPDAPHCPLAIIRVAHKALHVPIVGIGGINFSNYQQALATGCDAVAMISALFND